METERRNLSAMSDLLVAGRRAQLCANLDQKVGHSLSKVAGVGQELVRLLAGLVVAKSGHGPNEPRYVTLLQHQLIHFRPSTTNRSPSRRR